MCSDSVATSCYRLWDQALDFGTKGTKLTQNLFYSCTLSTIFADRQCQYYKNRIPSGENHFDHLCNAHLHKPYNENIILILDVGGKTVLDVAAVISNLHYLSATSVCLIFHCRIFCTSLLLFTCYYHYTSLV